VAQTNVMVIFDASGSMKRSTGSETRIVAAKRAISETLAAMPQEVRTGLLVFGHRRARDCSDIEVVSPIGADDARTQARMVEGLEAIGETPIAGALDRAGQSMLAFQKQSNSIVLVTDGIEECRGDPCAAADRLIALGIDVKVHVVGFALGAGESSSLQCVVQKTGGRYFDARDAQALRRTLGEVRQLVQAPPAPPAPQPAPPPPAPTERASKVVFEEKFDGQKLSADSWEMLNADPNQYIVEKGELMMVNAGAGGFQHKAGKNILRLLRDMPDGDWDVVIDAKLLFQTRSDQFSIGLMTDDKNYLSANVSWTGMTCNQVTVGINRVSDGAETKASKLYSAVCQSPFGEEKVETVVKAMDTNGVRLVLMKRERKYSASLEVKGWTDAKKNPRKITTDELTSLRSPGRLSFHVGKIDARAPSETNVRIDEVVIRVYE
jgi:hypothetical protein